MKIGFVLDDTLDTADGVQQYVLTLGKWLANRGHDVHYLVGQTERKDMSNIHSLTRNIRVSFNRNKMTIPLPASTKRIQAVLRKIDLDVLHIQMPYSPQMAAKIISKKSKSTAAVGTFHILPHSTVETLATHALGKLLKKNLALIDDYIAVSEPAKQFAKQSFKIDCQVIPNPVVIDKSIVPPARSEACEIVFVGRLVERKGVMHLLEAFKLLHDRNPQVHLTICGKGDLLPKVQKEIKAYHLSKVVKLAGFVSEKEKTIFLSQADIAVFPSTGGESFGIVLTEAMAAGAGVVIGGDNPGYRSVLKDSKTLFDPTKPQVLARLMEELLADPILRKKIHNEQQILVRSYDIDVVGPKIENFYQLAIANYQKKRNN